MGQQKSITTIKTTKLLHPCAYTHSKKPLFHRQRPSEQPVFASAACAVPSNKHRTIHTVVSNGYTVEPLHPFFKHALHLEALQTTMLPQLRAVSSNKHRISHTTIKTVTLLKTVTPSYHPPSAPLGTHSWSLSMVVSFVYFIPVYDGSCKKDAKWAARYYRGPPSWSQAPSNDQRVAPGARHHLAIKHKKKKKNYNDHAPRQTAPIGT